MRSLRSIGVGFCVLAFTGAAGAQNVITNGGFEAGLAGWNSFASPSFDAANYAWAGGPAPMSGFAVQGPRSGNLYGLTDQIGQSYQGFSQSFLFNGYASSAIFNYSLFVNTHWPYQNCGTGLTDVSCNEYATVDILRGTDPLSNNPSDVVLNTFLGAGPDANNPWADFSFDVTGALNAAGAGTYTVRFAQVQCCYFQEMGVDNVSLDINAVPEPGSILLMGTGLLTMGAFARRRSKKS
jgi:hypothetical protein